MVFAFSVLHYSVVVPDGAGLDALLDDGKVHGVEDDLLVLRGLRLAHRTSEQRGVLVLAYLHTTVTDHKTNKVCTKTNKLGQKVIIQI